ncbi:MAG: hypothetical protein WDO73_02250 [Ignavibacteriota bacterium]
MASTKRAFYIVDLVRDRKLFTNLDIPPIRVNITIEVEADVPKAKMDRLEKAARERLDDYEKVITKEAEKFNKQIEGLLNDNKLKEAIAAADQSNHAIKNALASAQGAALTAVENAKKQEAQGDKLLIQARVKVVVTSSLAELRSRPTSPASAPAPKSCTSWERKFSSNSRMKSSSRKTCWTRSANTSSSAAPQSRVMPPRTG